MQTGNLGEFYAKAFGIPQEGAEWWGMHAADVKQGVPGLMILGQINGTGPDAYALVLRVENNQAPPPFMGPERLSVEEARAKYPQLDWPKD